jgi:hypothetical protein
LSRSDETASIRKIVEDLDRALRRKDSPLPPVPAGGGVKFAVMTDATGAKPGAALVLSEDERRALVDVLTARLTLADGTARASTVKGWLMAAGLYVELAGEDYSGSAETIAITLVTKAEALGVRLDGHRAILMLVSALRARGYVDPNGLKFLAQLERRLQGVAIT